MATIRPILELGKDDEGRLVSSEEFAEADFDEPWKYEREDGRLIVLPTGGEAHIDASEPWRDRLVIYKTVHAEIVQRVVSEAWIRVDGGTDRVGDIGLHLNPDGPVQKIPDRIPDLMFEFVRPDKTSQERDSIRKRSDYHRFGVKEYVIVDRFKRIVTVFTYSPVDYSERVLFVDQVYETPLLPDFLIRLSDVF